ncbi:MAG: ABC transporter ATP-binding protein [Clostridia bacterium]|nr:ABC transporter ATP-binding protein [Clostridia bacterium]
MKRWFKYIKPYLPFFILGPVCMIIEVFGEVLMPKFLSYIVDFGAKDSYDAVTMALKGAQTAALGIDEVVPKLVRDLYSLLGDNAPFIVAIMVGMIFTAVLMMIGGIGGAYFGAKASVNFATDLRADLYGKIQKFSFANIDKFSTGSLVTRLTNDVTQLQNFCNMMLRMFFRAPGMMIGALIMAISVNPKLSVILAVSVPVLLVGISVIIGRGFSRFSKMQTKIDGLNSTVGENLTNARVVKSFVREDFERKKFGRANRDLKENAEHAMENMIFMQPLMTFVMNATVIAVLWFGGNQLVGGEMTDGELAMYVTYITQILSSLMMVSFLFVMFSRALASGKRIAEVLDEKIDIEDPEVLSGVKVERGEIEFKNVSFRYYKNSDEPVLDNINLKIKAGETVGIIGSTGCGKTTLVSLIARLYDADGGEVLVDGVNVKDYSLYDLREGVGMVLQKNTLFSGSIEDNLRWGDENADTEAIRAAADAAQADGFVTEFTEGYNTNIGQGGAGVSGGQKQRLCIARALLKKPKIIILDDSTSAVDTATEAKIRETFRTGLKDSTKIIIAQRIGSVRDADRIVVMNDGRITGVGTHEELLAGNAEYGEIYYSQIDKNEEGGKGAEK